MPTNRLLNLVIFVLLMAGAVFFPPLAILIRYYAAFIFPLLALYLLFEIVDRLNRICAKLG